ncbi:MAG: DUF2591 domain-containing protein [Gammaproteobacteria bacterium]|nr:DUF2591 domain-containing protein [Gammaproteobacteria bacterium]MBU1803852.1 DUF2591 domain-containing protein [Gammaproteobacteria bacterium]
MTLVEVKTIELEGKALDWAVAMSEGATNLYFDTVSCWWFTLNGRDRVLSSGWSEKQNYCPSTDWRYGGPLIEREAVSLTQFSDHPKWTAKHPASVCFDGPTPLIAAMRCLVVAKLGEVVMVPQELLP